MKKNSLIFLTGFLVLFAACETEKIPPGFTENKPRNSAADPVSSARVETSHVTQMYEAVGTIRPLTESVIESQVSAKILKVFFSPGKSVQKDQVLIRLDSGQLKAREKQALEGASVARNNLRQAGKAMDEADARLDQAESTYARTKKLYDSDIVPVQKLEMDKAAFLEAKARLEKSREGAKAAQASVRQAEQVVKEAQIALGWTEIRAPAQGVVTKRTADPGDLAVPGKPLMVIQTSGALRLEANVREGLISRVSIGGQHRVRIDTVSKTVDATIEEIVPYADPATRTFLVKAALPHTPGVYPGMFGRLMIPVGWENTLIIPLEAVIRVGQLEQTRVLINGEWQRVYIKTGRTFEQKVEVLAGLSGDETVGW